MRLDFRLRLLYYPLKETNMLYALEPVKVKAMPGCHIDTAIGKAKALSHMIGKSEVHLNFNGTIHVVKGDTVKTLSNFK